MRLFGVGCTEVPQRAVFGDDGNELDVAFDALCAQFLRVFGLGSDQQFLG